MPVTDEAMRQYERKTLFIKLLPQIRRIQDDTNRNQAAAQARLQLFQNKVGDVLDGIGVYADLRHQYLAYAQALDKTQRELRYMVDWIREHQILRDRFERRGLDASVLDAIDQLVIYRTADL